MHLSELLTIPRIDNTAEVGSKKRVLEQISELLSTSPGAPAQSEIFTSLLGREKLGSTGLGQGVALPHGRVSGIRSAAGALMRLEQPVDFDSIDDQPVDLVFGMIVPEAAEQAHLDLLAQLARLFSDAELCARIRQAHSAEEVLELIRATHPQP